MTEILQQGARLYFGDQTSVNSPTWFRGGVEVLTGLIFPWSRIFIVGLALVALGALWLLLYRSYAGLNVRAVMQNRDTPLFHGAQSGHGTADVSGTPPPLGLDAEDQIRLAFGRTL